MEKGYATHSSILGLPWWLRWSRICLQCGRPGFELWVGKIPWRKERLSTPVFWPGKFHGLYRPWGRKELDTTERLSLHFKLQRLEGPGHNHPTILLCQQSPQASFSLHHHLRCSLQGIFLSPLTLPTRQGLLKVTSGSMTWSLTGSIKFTQFCLQAVSYKDVLTLSWYLVYTYSISIVLNLFSQKWETGSFKMPTQSHSREKTLP